MGVLVLLQGIGHGGAVRQKVHFLRNENGHELFPFAGVAVLSKGPSAWPSSRMDS